MLASLPPALVFLAGAALLLVLPRRARTVVVLATPVATFAVLLGLAEGAGTTVDLYGYTLSPLRVDGLSLAFGYVFCIAAFAAGLYGLRTMPAGEQAVAYAYAGGGLGAVFAGDLVTFFVFWEAKAVASAVLIMSRRTPESAKAGLRYLYVHFAGGTILLAGILGHIATTGSTAFVGFDAGAPAYLMLVGVALSAAIPPLHAWLPDAYPRASVAGAVFLSAFTTKAGVYALARGFAGYELLVWFGVAMALYGVVYAVLANDIRELLAYHIVSQVGFMVTGVGLGTEAAINGATAHAFAHILYKGLLLMGAGAVLAATGRDKLTELGGIARLMPWVVVLYMIGAFSISGFPLFSGFVSKELVVNAAGLEGRDIVVALLKLASVGTFLHTGLKLPYFTWFGPRQELAVQPTPPTMYAGMALLAVINIAIGVYPTLLYDLLPFPVTYEPYTAGKLVETTQLLAFTAFGFWLLRGKLGGEATISVDTDWAYRRLPELVAPRVAATSDRAGAAAALLSQRGRRTATTLVRAGQRRSSGADAPILPTWLLGTVLLGTFVVALALSLLP